MELVTPSIGLLFWMLLSFSIVLYLLKKFAWSPIIKMLKERENSIEEALSAADKAREEMAKLHAENEKIIADANNERKKIIAEAYVQNHEIVSNSKAEAQEEADKIIQSARETIEYEKNLAIQEIRHFLADLSIDVAKKVLERELNEESKQRDYIETVLNNMNLN
jgi:F-type H+-transporting ATPase subunit b